MKLMYAAEFGWTGYPETSVFQGLSGGKIEQLADVGVGVGEGGAGVRVGVWVAFGVGVFVFGGVGVAEARGVGVRVGVGVARRFRRASASLGEPICRSWQTVIASANVASFLVHPMWKASEQIRCRHL